MRGYSEDRVSITAKQHDDDHRAAVDEHLHQRQELGKQEQVRAGRAQQGQEQEQRRVNHVASGYHAHGPAEREDGHDGEKG